MVDTDEQARRLRAAIAYSGKTDDTIASAVGTSIRSLRRWKKEGLPNDADPRTVRTITNACDVPYAWFTADLAQLWRIPADPADEFTQIALAAGGQPDAQHDRRYGQGRREDDRG